MHETLLSICILQLSPFVCIFTDLLRKNSLHSKLTKFNEEELMYIYREHVKAVRGDLGSRRLQVGCIMHIY